MVIAWHAGQNICYPFSRHFKRHSCCKYLDVSKNGWTCCKLPCICVVTQGTNRCRQLLEPVCPQVRPYEEVGPQAPLPLLRGRARVGVQNGGRVLCHIGREKCHESST